MDEGALGRLHLRTGVVQSLAAPHDGTQRFLQRGVQLGLVQPVGAKTNRDAVRNGAFSNTFRHFYGRISPEKLLKKGLKVKRFASVVVERFVPNSVYDNTEHYNDYTLINY